MKPGTASITQFHISVVIVPQPVAAITPLASGEEGEEEGEDGVPGLVASGLYPE